jgi:hypothetical protein
MLMAFSGDGGVVSAVTARRSVSDRPGGGCQGEMDLG